MSTLWSASWKTGWYNLDQSMTVGRRDAFAFSLPGPGAGPEHDLTFATWSPWEYWVATVVSIEHARFGSVLDVDTAPFGQYTFRFADGTWVTVEAEERLANVNAASPDFPVDECDVAWAHTGGWDLHVTLADVEGPVTREEARTLMLRRAVDRDDDERIKVLLAAGADLSDLNDVPSER